MSDQKKREAAVKILRELGEWDASGPASFEMASGGEFRAGPISCLTVGKRHRFFISGVDVTRPVSDMLGLGLRGDAEDGVAFRTFSGSPQRELIDWVLRKAPELVAERELEGQRAARAIAAVCGLIGASSRQNPDGSSMVKLAEAIKEAGGAPEGWSLNRKRFEAELFHLAPDECGSFFKTRRAAGGMALMDLAKLASGSQWSPRQAQCEELAQLLGELGCWRERGDQRAADVFEKAGMGSVAALLEAQELRGSLNGAPGGQRPRAAL